MKEWNREIVKKKLIELSKKMGFKLPQTQLLLAQERFLARLAQSPYRDNFVWKGGSLLIRRYSFLNPPRYTIDIDLLIKKISLEKLKAIMEEIFAIDLNDGFKFLSVKIFPMERDTPYGGDRLEIDWNLNDRPGSQILRIDICAGDDVAEQKIPIGELFLIPDDNSELALNIYPSEFIFAEKLETIVRFKTGNTRLKDIIDMWTLIKKGIDIEKLNIAVGRCFVRRGVEFSLDEINKILQDKDFVLILENSRLRNYQKLKTPDVPTLFNEIKKCISKIKISI